MPELKWYIIIIIVLSLLISGAIGAIIHYFFYKYQHRTQPIGRRVDVFPKFEDLQDASCLRTQLKIAYGNKSYEYDEVTIAQIQLSNQGDRDFDEFKMGITLSDGNTAIYIEAQSPDRQHQVQQITPVNCKNPESEIDLILRPFNRTDTYSLRLLMLSDEQSEEPEKIEFSSPEPVRFVNLPTTTEVLEEAARSASLGVGPFNISLGG